MSQYVYKFIEFKVNNEWHWIVFENPLSFINNKIQVLNPIDKNLKPAEQEFHKLKYDVSRYCLKEKINKSSILLSDEYGYEYQQVSRDGIFEKYFAYDCKGMPEDISSKLKLFINELTENDKIASNITYVNLNTLSELRSQEYSKMVYQIARQSIISVLENIHRYTEFMCKEAAKKFTKSIDIPEKTSSSSHALDVEMIIEDYYYNLKIFDDLLEKMYTYIDIVSSGNHYIEDARYIFAFE